MNFTEQHVAVAQLIECFYAGGGRVASLGPTTDRHRVVCLSKSLYLLLAWYWCNPGRQGIIYDLRGQLILNDK